MKESTPPEQAAPDGNIWSEVRRLQEIRLRAAVTQEPSVAFSADDMKFVLSLIDQRDRAFKELIRAKPDQPQAASGGGTLDVQKKFTRALVNNNTLEQLLLCNWTKDAARNPVHGLNINGLVNSLVDLLGEPLASHDQKVRNDALEEASLAVNGVHTSYHHNDSAETIGTFVRRHSAAIQERIRSLAM